MCIWWLVLGAHVWMHCLQIVHRDIKSKNVLLTKNSQSAKIADVGLSRVLDSLSFSSANIAYGTFAYAAPEVLLGYACTEKVGHAMHSQVVLVLLLSSIMLC